MPELAQLLQRTAVAYARVSTADQATRGGQREGFSIPAQREAISAKAQTLGAAIVAEFVDAGESARSADRPELQRMLAYLRDNRVDMVIVHKIDRLARNRADDVAITMAIRESGAQLVSVTESVDETPQGQLVHGIFSAVAEFYSRNLAQEVIKGQKQKVLAGGTLSKAPVGYLNVRRIINGSESREIELDPERAHHVRWAFDTYASDPDITVAKLTELLADRGLTLRATANQSARTMSRTQVHKMLRSRYYVGVITWQGVEHPGSHEAIVDEQTYAAVQERLEANRHGANRERHHFHYLSGSVFCGRCESRLLFMNVTNAKGNSYEYFACSGRHAKSNDCDVRFIPVGRVEEAVERLWRAEMGVWQTTGVEPIRNELLGHLRALRNDSDRETDSLKQRIHKLRRDRLKWADLAMEGAVPTDIAREKQDGLTKQLETLTADLSSLERAGINTEETLNAVLDLIADPGRAYAHQADRPRRMYNQAWFSSVFIDVNEDGPEVIDATAERTPLAQSLEESRQVAAAILDNKAAGAEAPAASRHLGMDDVHCLSKSPLVEHSGFEPLTFSMPLRRSTN